MPEAELTKMVAAGEGLYPASKALRAMRRVSKAKRVALFTIVTSDSVYLTYQTIELAKSSTKRGAAESCSPISLKFI